MDGNFSGFVFTPLARPQISSSAKPAEAAPSRAKFDLSLDDLIKEKETKRGGKRQRGAAAEDSDLGSPGRGRESSKRVVPLHLPRDIVDQLCASLQINTKGYRPFVEAILTK
jgi:hypothetical protein